MRYPITFIGSLLLVGLCGCKQESSTSATTTSPSSQAAVQRAYCVICVHHEMDVDATTATADYQGKRYYFCSDHCKEEFSKDPAHALAEFEAKKAEKARGG